mmetsp:Transcript_10022/g.15211  ORF Transcript_10022/g.15211 Transcript_10022/m.15211 type:complete len:184 (+) Transcript_10022:373-924(+)
MGELEVNGSTNNRSLPQSSATLKANISIPTSKEVSVFKTTDFNTSVEFDMGASMFNPHPIRSLKEITEQMRQAAHQPSHQSLQFVKPKDLNDEIVTSIPSTAREEAQVETFREQDENQNSQNMVMTETPAEGLLKGQTPLKQQIIGSEMSSDAKTVHMNQTYRFQSTAPLSQKVQSRKDLLSG